MEYVHVTVNLIIYTISHAITLLNAGNLQRMMLTDRKRHGAIVLHGILVRGRNAVMLFRLVLWQRMEQLYV
jgi:hypothetical protein